ncbi:MAG: hypothetical protein APF80_09190 [Alphaproteobacteria bacterium BRH_c36]|nr:MAG: hypothetical protein APF80_14285 [Alphaproteobacteria bacterium BRH_c36]KUO69376.1 MAG: hypothetical protein APF80_09190 [Alphaproteobacteria bacterium BRH_c36]
MTTTRKLYTNFRAGDYAINFFMLNAKGTQSAQLACPFFTTPQPIQLLHDDGCRNIKVIIRLCGATTPAAIASVRSLPGVTLRYFTSQAFHAKFYILDSLAMLGSANLTDAGMSANREIAITIDSEDEVFDELPTYFDDLWDSAAVLTDAVLARFALWHRSPSNTQQSDVIDGVEPCSPRTINVATHTKTRERTYLESFRREYYETILPAHREMQAVYNNAQTRHPAFHGLPLEYEIDRFLNWAKLKYTTDETLLNFPLLDEQQRRLHIAHHVGVWLGENISIDHARTERLEKLRATFQTRDHLSQVSLEDLTDALLGCAAFDEQLRFTKGGQPALVRAFYKDNDLARLKTTFDHLAFGKEEFVRRTYDCIFTTEYKLAHFGRTSILELFGWVNPEGIPPVNGRTIKALRYFGFPVKA